MIMLLDCNTDTLWVEINNYVLDMTDVELKALEEKYNAPLPPNRRFIYPETEFTSRDYMAKGFEVKTIAFNYKGLAGMDELNGLRNASRELYELINQVNQKAITWVSEEKFSDVNAPTRTNYFTNLNDYTQHIFKRQFGIPGDNPNGMVFPDPNNSNELVYTGIVYKENTTNGIFPAYYKVYALPYSTIKGIGCEILIGKTPNRISRYVRRSPYGSIQSLKISDAAQLSPEPFNFDGTLNIAFSNSSSKRKAKMLQSHHVSAGSRMLFRNAFKNAAKKALAKSSELTAKTIGTKAVVSIGYQTITQDGKVNLVTVLGDSFFSPFVGAALGNSFTLNFNV